MITIVLSEKDFDYEIQALVNSFFPGQKSRVLVEQEYESREEEFLTIGIRMEHKKIQVSVCSATELRSDFCTVLGTGDWHKHPDKLTNPYRTYYKNELKRLLFCMLRDFPKDSLPEDVTRKIPSWGTMTGVRPTKISMKELLSGKSRDQVRQELESVYCCSPDKIELGLDIASKEAEILKKVDYANGYSLYIGIPFCPTTCLYCSFPSYPFEQFGHLMDDYLDALEQEIRAVAKQMEGIKLTSIYIGGGTPTALTAEGLERLICLVRDCYPVKDSYEFTVEAGRPDSITRQKLEVLARYGVSRISINPQTMQQKTLDLIGRKHSVSQTRQAFTLARELGFTNINMDLIIGLVGETVDDFADTLLQIKECNPDSITIHSLVVKRASKLRTVIEELAIKKRKNTTTDLDVLVEQSERQRAKTMEAMLEMGIDFAKKQGYEPYYMYRQKNSAGHAGSTGQENIGFARPGKECIYNILIMEEMQTIVAVGAGASTKIFDPARNQVYRIENVKSITDYMTRVEEMIARKCEKNEINSRFL